MTAADRALAALTGLALGDALGMPSQTLDRVAIRATYGRIDGFRAPVEDHPVSHGLHAAQVTDDTEQALLLARRIIADAPGFDEAAWAQDLLAWEAEICARGLRDLLGPSTKAALLALQAGVSAAGAGRDGATNGAAMRIAPVGIATPPDPARMVARVAQVSRVTHGRGEALAGAAAVAMVISQGIAGMAFEEALPLALSTAALPPAAGDAAGHKMMADRIALALEVALRGEEALAGEIGTSVQSLQSVACAFGVVRLAGGDPWQAALIAANIGDDTDTIGAIACAMAAACAGMESLPAEQVAQLYKANRLDFAPLVRGLLAQRKGTA
jgi:ADP-ribosylglycohydrolase